MSHPKKVKAATKVIREHRRAMRRKEERQDRHAGEMRVQEQALGWAIEIVDAIGEYYGGLRRGRKPRKTITVRIDYDGLLCKSDDGGEFTYVIGPELHRKVKQRLKPFVKSGAIPRVLSVAECRRDNYHDRFKVVVRAPT